ncbi:hypothetical protein BLNAU_19175 [Blattamonas nauphoetae]|uniref:Uncharacterized protein n=1 Tax=Blattamonas nauphoetae TaxID=2049346 RepID=A0ABQ9X3F2_9EUKA|nr:hypothetical protein BLNAU_19175 [Blattamonas nauphoetae]
MKITQEEKEEETHFKHIDTLGKAVKTSARNRLQPQNPPTGSSDSQLDFTMFSDIGTPGSSPNYTNFSPSHNRISKQRNESSQPMFATYTPERKNKHARPLVSPPNWKSARLNEEAESTLNPQELFVLLAEVWAEEMEHQKTIASSEESPADFTQRPHTILLFQSTLAFLRSFFISFHHSSLLQSQTNSPLFLLSLFYIAILAKFNRYQEIQYLVKANIIPPHPELVHQLLFLSTSQPDHSVYAAQLLPTTLHLAKKLNLFGLVMACWLAKGDLESMLLLYKAKGVEERKAKKFLRKQQESLFNWNTLLTKLESVVRKIETGEYKEHLERQSWEDFQRKLLIQTERKRRARTNKRANSPDSNEDAHPDEENLVDDIGSVDSKAVISLKSAPDVETETADDGFDEVIEYFDDINGSASSDVEYEYEVYEQVIDEPAKPISLSQTISPQKSSFRTRPVSTVLSSLSGSYNVRDTQKATGANSFPIKLHESSAVPAPIARPVSTRLSDMSFRKNGELMFGDRFDSQRSPSRSADQDPFFGRRGGLTPSQKKQMEKNQTACAKAFASGKYFFMKDEEASPPPAESESAQASSAETSAGVKGGSPEPLEESVDVAEESVVEEDVKEKSALEKSSNLTFSTATNNFFLASLQRQQRNSNTPSEPTPNLTISSLFASRLVAEEFDPSLFDTVTNQNYDQLGLNWLGYKLVKKDRRLRKRTAPKPPSIRDHDDDPAGSPLSSGNLQSPSVTPSPPVGSPSILPTPIRASLLNPTAFPIKKNGLKRDPFFPASVLSPPVIMYPTLIFDPLFSQFTISFFFKLAIALNSFPTVLWMLEELFTDYPYWKVCWSLTRQEYMDNLEKVYKYRFTPIHPSETDTKKQTKMLERIKKDWKIHQAYLLYNELMSTNN